MKYFQNTSLLAGVIVSLIGIVGMLVIFSDNILPLVFKPTESELPTREWMSSGDPTADDGSAVETTGGGAQLDALEAGLVAESLQVPWEVVFLPDGSYLITERPGTVVRAVNGELTRVSVSGVQEIGEGGLLGMELHPDFAKNNWIYLYFTTEQGGEISNRVERFTLSLTPLSLNDRVVIIDGIPGAQNHNGGRIVFGPDNNLYIGTGDAQKEELAQVTTSLAGKILRVTAEGEIPKENPFQNEVFAYGLRNPQGLAFDETGALWVTDHGPSGVQSGMDEINTVQLGKNYGWPVIRADETREGMETPVIQSGPRETWAPASITIIGEKIFFAGLRGESVYTATIQQPNLVQLEALARGVYGRVRVIKKSPDDKWLYLATSNTDGRGTKREGDDQLIRLPVLK